MRICGLFSRRGHYFLSVVHDGSVHAPLRYASWVRFPAIWVAQRSRRREDRITLLDLFISASPYNSRGSRAKMFQMTAPSSEHVLWYGRLWRSCESYHSLSHLSLSHLRTMIVSADGHHRHHGHAKMYGCCVTPSLPFTVPSLRSSSASSLPLRHPS